MVTVAIFCGGVLPSRADLSAPDNVVYGIVVQGSNQVTAAATEFTVEARRTNGLLVARYRMGEQTAVGNHYVLAIPVEELAPPRDAAAVLTGEVLTITVLSNLVVQAQQSFPVHERGQVQRLDFGAAPPGSLTFELWALKFGLDANSQLGDADADGLSNLAEYWAGTNPTNASSKFVFQISQTNGLSRVSFEAVRAQGLGYDGQTRHYALEQLSALPDSTWQLVPGFADIIGADQEVIYATPSPGTPRFFRGKVWLAAAALNEFRLTAHRHEDLLVISFPAAGPDAQGNHRYYTLEHAANPNLGAWQAVPGCSNILGAGQTVTHSAPVTGTSAGFYRGRIELRHP